MPRTTYPSGTNSTGIRYHFPKRYSRFIPPGTVLIHYKGRLVDKTFIAKRLSKDPYYFGTSIAGLHTDDTGSTKADRFVEILDYKPFLGPVPIRLNGDLIELIPPNRATNFWRDGVRPTSRNVYEQIVRLGGLVIADQLASDSPEDHLTSHITDGGKQVTYSSRYERNPAVRKKGIEIHGYKCWGCENTMEALYGSAASELIHIHHKRPLSSEQGPMIVDPTNDLAPLCPNCHSVVHLKGDLRSVNEVRAMQHLPAILLGDHPKKNSA